MKQTVVSVFDSYATAQQAALQLRELGLADSVSVTDEVEAGSVPPATGVAPSATQTDDDRGVLAHIRSLFAELFGREACWRRASHETRCAVTFAR